MINFTYFFYSLIPLFLTSLLSTIFTSLYLTGEAGLNRLIDRNGRQTKNLLFWQKHWKLLCKSVQWLLTSTAMTTFILFYHAVESSTLWIKLTLLLLLSLCYMLIAHIIPYILSESYADRISLTFLPFAGTLARLAFPIVWPLQLIERHLLRRAMLASDEEDRPSPEDEIKSLINETDQEDLEEEEREIIRSVFEFGDTIVREIMTPRIDISGLKDQLTVDECIEQVKESRHSRFPVYHENIDDVIGMVHVKDLLKLSTEKDGKRPINQLVKKVDFVPESMPINDLMKLMKRTRAQLVLVVDEYGGTEGLVSMEDIIEELVGEIEDEYDLKEKELHRHADGSIMVQARIPLCELNEELDIHLPESAEYDSLGGYVFAKLGHIPAAGETVETLNYTLRIHSATRRQILIIHLIPKTKP